ncbi:MAG: sugar phosphate isomerase/epimerase and 4-hydroxyphenylpyruvate domain-containing protein [Geminicoccaceae bacterium]|nr:sugar phosphate isomerase/epimerase and 4-hydroxyphenylpyruvate domain-containing protein [Geminicoccaceae bacterium]MCX8102257.1 sugar phosphate isomerase/epimerase and 4-hydroxyphenylpyruvate domain-containing protein [Geminicoccaceae bacterium]MDW8371166.1 TIM barrel protein [Geminicoccaceae bacterium]
MRRAIATVSMAGSLAEKLEAAASVGFDGIELFEADLTYFPGTPEEVAGRARELGLAIVALQPFRDAEGLPLDERARMLDRLERKLDLMQRLGTRLLLVCSQTRPDTTGEPERLAEDLRLMAERAAARGLGLGYEALAWGRHVSDWRQAWELVRRADHPALGLILDTFHLLVRGSPTAPIRELPAEKIVLVQTADAPAIAMEPLFWSRHYRCFPGQGELDVEGVLRELASTGWDGWLSHEIFSDDFRSTSARQAATDGMRSFLFIEERLGRSSMPPRPQAKRLAFVEFVESAERAEPFRATLRALGLPRTHRHRSKRVELYRAGEVAIVLNLEDEGFPHAFQLLHGLSVAAIAIETDAAERARARAAALGATPFVSPVGAGELVIPAVRGVAGSLLFFLDPPRPGSSFHEIDFLPDPDPRPVPDTGLVAIDHLAQVVPPAELPSWVLFYRALFGLEPERRTDLVDPRGPIVSRALESADGAVRIVLNSSPAQTSAAGRFLARTAGAGAQHVAIACRDLLAAARAIPSELKLPIPANYYDDLEARFGLDREFVCALRAAGALYDRIGSGELLQLYTRSLNGFFFELVERRGGYDRYGEANTPVRLAAQAELDRSPAEALTLSRAV